MSRKLNKYPCLNMGFTIIELMIVLAIVGLLAMVALPSYQDYIERVDVNSAISDLKSMSLTISNYQLDNGSSPASLAEVNLDGMVDPWGNAYSYLNHATAPNNSRKRKDRNTVPINTDYDLYSSGKDGSSAAPLNSSRSLDDIVRGNNGKFVGLAEDY